MCTAERGVPLHGTGVVARTTTGMPIASILLGEDEDDIPEYKAWFSTMKLIMESTLDKRAVFISAAGYVGLVPRYAREGDKVSVVFGHDVPVVLREVTGTGPWTLIGECYVASMMDGEYAVLLEEGGFDNTLAAR
ncbi:hypothetical protein M011DRAFT_472600 [Sporormia fimetaria CBS 119925]|uniref:Uncharacterized protein n=1 Tax=Sporormia fimetaria CBS 119925 TaxID=1340428 RepID=A0A6A6UX91_9PLEO|nr:hypothetical protein M011DRAFT_472600 [Sporormia fimetaria CBS 119925]